jgi:hypothetical protein
METYLQDKEGNLVNVADIVNPKTGKTFRQENKEKTHKYNVGDRVFFIDNCSRDPGLRTMVVKELTRDCDQTPLYNLIARTYMPFEQELIESLGLNDLVKELIASPAIVRGISEENIYPFSYERFGRLLAQFEGTEQNEKLHSEESIERAIITLRDIVEKELNGRGISAILMLQEQIQILMGKGDKQ